MHAHSHPSSRLKTELTKTLVQASDQAGEYSVRYSFDGQIGIDAASSFTVSQ